MISPYYFKCIYCAHLSYTHTYIEEQLYFPNFHDPDKSILIILNIKLTPFVQVLDVTKGLLNGVAEITSVIYNNANPQNSIDYYIQKGMLFVSNIQWHTHGKGMPTNCYVLFCFCGVNLFYCVAFYCLLLIIHIHIFMHLKEEDTRIIELAMYESDARKVVCEVSKLPYIIIQAVQAVNHEAFHNDVQSNQFCIRIISLYFLKLKDADL